MKPPVTSLQTLGLLRGLSNYRPTVKRVSSGCRLLSMPSKKEIDDTLKKHKVVVYSKSYCPYCKNAKKALSDLGITYEAIELDQKPDGESTQGILKTMTGASSVPRVFINGKFFGGGDDTVAGAKNGKIMSLLKA